MLLCTCACSRHEPSPAPDGGAPAPNANQRSASATPKPELLYLPDAGDEVLPRATGHELLAGPWGLPSRRCPTEMVDIRGQFCIDRFEVTLVERNSEQTISPYYHPTRAQVRRTYAFWQQYQAELGTRIARSMPIPVPPPWQLETDFEPVARSRAVTLPNGYLSGELAARACRNAGKRLCRLDEWMAACRGQQNRKFPYGDYFEPGKCNVAREAHPAQVLHGDPSIRHLDPRLNLVHQGARPLLQKTGAEPTCASQWGADAVFDMVGNLDEWVDDAEGTFAGGFYSRGTHDGCDARISSHPFNYFDYSLGTRCCK